MSSLCSSFSAFSDEFRRRFSSHYNHLDSIYTGIGRSEEERNSNYEEILTRVDFLLKEHICTEEKTLAELRNRYQLIHSYLAVLFQSLPFLFSESDSAFSKSVKPLDEIKRNLRSECDRMDKKLFETLKKRQEFLLQVREKLQKLLSMQEQVRNKEEMIEWKKNNFSAFADFEALWQCSSEQVNEVLKNFNEKNDQFLAMKFSADIPERLNELIDVASKDLNERRMLFSKVFEEISFFAQNLHVHANREFTTVDDLSIRMVNEMKNDKKDKDDENALWSEVNLSSESLKKLEDRRNQLKEKWNERTGKIDRISKQILDLWSRLSVPSSYTEEFLCTHSSITETTISACEKELQRLLLLKKEKLKSWIESTQRSCLDYISLLELGEESAKLKFPFIYRNSSEEIFVNDSTLNQLENDLKSLEKFYNCVQPLRRQLQAHEEFLASYRNFLATSSDPQRFHNPKYSAVKESKERAHYQKEIPAREKVLKSAVSAFEEEFQEKFFWRGQPFLETFIEENERAEKEKKEKLEENKRKKEAEKKMREIAEHRGFNFTNLSRSNSTSIPTMMNQTMTSTMLAAAMQTQSPAPKSARANKKEEDTQQAALMSTWTPATPQRALFINTHTHTAGKDASNTAASGAAPGALQLKGKTLQFGKCANADAPSGAKGIHGSATKQTPKKRNSDPPAQGKDCSDVTKSHAKSATKKSSLDDDDSKNSKAKSGVKNSKAGGAKNGNGTLSAITNVMNHAQ